MATPGEEAQGEDPSGSGLNRRTSHNSNTTERSTIPKIARLQEELEAVEKRLSSECSRRLDVWFSDEYANVEERTRALIKERRRALVLVDEQIKSIAREKCVLLKLIDLALKDMMPVDPDDELWDTLSDVSGDTVEDAPSGVSGDTIEDAPSDVFGDTVEDALSDALSYISDDNSTDGSDGSDGSGDYGGGGGQLNINADPDSGFDSDATYIPDSSDSSGSDADDESDMGSGFGEIKGSANLEGSEKTRKRAREHGDNTANEPSSRRTKKVRRYRDY
ncbi:hypothetical protein PG990_010493 [Apiospora arundinis]